ncbi:hypothetical protein [Terrimonas pollutisoli]|uniref:hypothetical protein n=1 Tax=Terrimonas pollutisoli TaxID=3034147 RepID=UPI0023EA8598|nr:hypothetical protein [Terrimonas sp. H1YJ31]
MRIRVTDDPQDQNPDDFNDGRVAAVTGQIFRTMEVFSLFCQGCLGFSGRVATIVAFDKIN